MVCSRNEDKFVCSLQGVRAARKHQQGCSLGYQMCRSSPKAATANALVREGRYTEAET